MRGISCEFLALKKLRVKAGYDWVWQKVRMPIGFLNPWMMCGQIMWFLCVSTLKTIQRLFMCLYFFLFFFSWTKGKTWRGLVKYNCLLLRTLCAHLNLAWPGLRSRNVTYFSFFNGSRYVCAAFSHYLRNDSRRVHLFLFLKKKVFISFLL